MWLGLFGTGLLDLHGNDTGRGVHGLLGDGGGGVRLRYGRKERGRADRQGRNVSDTGRGSGCQ